MIDLQTNNTRLQIDLRGAFITSLKIGNQDILFPRSVFKTNTGESKTRGGLHVCLPNFGPSQRYSLNQHGFGRELDWRIVEQRASFVKLELCGGDKTYKDLQSILEINLNEDSLELQLALCNHGRTVLEVAPGFHPYFKIKDGLEEFLVNGEKLALKDLAGTIFRDNISLAEIGDYQFKFSQQNLSRFAIWTDRLSNYVCIEPTFAGNAFVNNTSDKMSAGETKQYSFEFKWEKA